MDERKIVLDLRMSRLKVKALEEELKEAKNEEMKKEHDLIEHLESIGAEESATYEGVRVALQKPRLFASFLKDNEEKVFEFVNNQGRSDLIKQTIHSSSLSAWVKERIEAGEEIPGCINFYLQPSVRIYEKN